MIERMFYCPVYEDEVNEYGCTEISTGIHLGRYLNDGMPPLVEIRTALERKYRCLTCEHCADHFKPKGLLPMQTMCNLGFPKDIKQFEEALKQVEQQHLTTLVSYNQGRIRCYQLPCGVQLWQEWDTQLDVMHDIQAIFLSANAMYLRVDQLMQYRRGGGLVRSAFSASARFQKGLDDDLIHSGFLSPNLSIFREDFAKETEHIAQITAFPSKLSCFDNHDDYLRRRETNLAPDSFVSGLAMPGGETLGYRADALLTGRVLSVSLLSNEVTGLPFYHVALSCLGRVFDVVAAPDMFSDKPASGNVLQAVCWLQAQVKPYDYPIDHYEIDVVTPLTAARFEPIRLAVLNLQPGQQLFCGIAEPLGDMVFIRAKAEVEGISVEFRLDPQLDADEEAFRIYRFYPVSRTMAIRMFEQTLVFHNPPRLEDAKDVTAEYLTSVDMP